MFLGKIYVFKRSAEAGSLESQAAVPRGHRNGGAQDRFKFNCPHLYIGTLLRPESIVQELTPAFVVVPCHRMIGKRGDLTGYHGALTRKRAMLGWEAGRIGAA